MDDIYYSPRYNDDDFEYRHVILPRVVAKRLQPGKLMSEAEWRRLGVQQSLGWEHYMIHNPEKHILLFRRKLEFTSRDEAMAKEKLMVEMDLYEKELRKQQAK